MAEARRLLAARAPVAATGAAAQAEANRRSVREARETGRFPERLTATVQPRPFDPRAYAADPQAYLDIVEPGRVWQTADGAPGVKTLAAVGPAFLDVEPGGTVVLEVTGEPFAPVTFTSFDLGAFENGLPSITVGADAAGDARAQLTAIPGTVEAVSIVAGSPLAVGIVRFTVQVARVQVAEK
jgi:hypothetical protein